MKSCQLLWYVLGQHSPDTASLWPGCLYTRKHAYTHIHSRNTQDAQTHKSSQGWGRNTDCFSTTRGQCIPGRRQQPSQTCPGQALLGTRRGGGLDRSGTLCPAQARAVPM